MQNFVMILSKHEKHSTKMVKYLMDILRDFSAFIDTDSNNYGKLLGKNPNPVFQMNKLAVDAFIESNMITRIVFLIKNI